MTTPKVTRAVSAAQRRGIQRQVTGLLVRSRRCTSPLSIPTSTGRARYSMSPGYQKPGRWASRRTPASQTNQRPRTETVAAYRTTSGSDRRPAQPSAVWIPCLPSASRGSRYRAACRDALRHCRPNASASSRAIPRRPPRSGATRANWTNRTRKSDRSTVSKRERPNFPFSPSETPEGHA